MVGSRLFIAIRDVVAERCFVYQAECRAGKVTNALVAFKIKRTTPQISRTATTDNTPAETPANIGQPDCFFGRNEATVSGLETM
jgi:hypothetical protein